MNITLAIALGGGLGSLARYFLSSFVSGFTGGSFPWGIFIVNVLGGLIMGMIVELGALKWSYGPEMRAFMTTGILGGFTTFSTFSLDTALLIEKGEWGLATLYVVGSVVLSIGALFAGLWLIRSVV